MAENRESNVALYGIALVLLSIVAYIYWPGKPRRGDPKVPVNGQVKVNGEPGKYMVIRFQSVNKSLIKQDQQPVAGADADGAFSMSSFGGNDGTVPGEYIVTFYWPSNPMTMGRDRLKGKFNDPANSKFRVTIDDQATVLPLFNLQIPKSEILPLEFDPASKN